MGSTTNWEKQDKLPSVPCFFIRKDRRENIGYGLGFDANKQHAGSMTSGIRMPATMELQGFILSVNILNVTNL